MPRSTAHKADGWTEELAASGLPTVFIGSPRDTGLGIHYVDVDSFEVVGWRRSTWQRPGTSPSSASMTI